MAEAESRCALKTPNVLSCGLHACLRNVQLWRCNSASGHGASTPNSDPMDVEFVADLQGHARTVNAVRFAPTGAS